MDNETAAIALEFVPRRLHIAWTTTALTYTEKYFQANRPEDWDHMLAHRDNFLMAVEYEIASDPVGQNGYETNFEIIGKVDEEFLDTDTGTIKYSVAEEFANQWVENIVEFVGEAQKATTLSPKEFVTYIMMHKSSCSEAEAADALGVTVGTYRGKKGRIKKKRQQCRETETLERLITQPTPERLSYHRSLGDRDIEVEGVEPSELYEAQLSAGRTHSLAYPRESSDQRRHETYEQGNWRTAHVDRVDKLFVADMSGKDDWSAIRLDFDGTGDHGADMHLPGENVQVSAWFTEEKARELYNQLEDQLDV